MASTVDLYALLDHSLYKKLLKLPDIVADLKRFCLFQFVIQHFAPNLKSSGKLEYLNSISRFDSEEQVYLIVMYAKSTLVCGACGDIVYFEFSKWAKNVRPKCFTC